MIRRPMKGAAVEDLSRVRFPVMASPKIDGFRCILERRPLTSRLSPFPNEHFDQSLTHMLELGAMLDGEVVVGKRRGKGVLQRTSSGLTSQSGIPDFKIWVFDCPMPNADFEARHNEAKEIVKKISHPRIKILKHEWIHDAEGLQDYLDECLEREFEGIVTRDPRGPYKEGKSTLREQWMLKVKPFEDAEGRVTGWYEEQENTNEAKREVTGKLKRSSAKAGKVAKGTLGGLILTDVKSGVEVRVGGGYTADQRRLLWEIRDQLRGQLVKYKKQSVGEKDKPRHPNFVEFLHFRPDWDMTD